MTKKLFTKIGKGCLFIAHNNVWMKTNDTVGKSIGPSQFGCCNFCIEGKKIIRV